ncbi:monocarboxylate permease-like protein [Podospora aff. communis PSN243]|uniref:Monocarboxylate permease-like protein n=1 Tax=Podospora aff. communis PSN243 TaxID=3040156 RepID=A0AAV9GKT5_9PEZI|nr:monocarboxylate permease-like protein [Podospora aff. communis PSN243]
MASTDEIKLDKIDVTPPQLPPGPDDFPEGGTRGWLVAAGTAGIMFCTLGYANSFGVFQAYYLQNQLKDHSPDEISWIGSLQVFLVFAVGVLGGPIFDRYGPWVIRPAAVVYFLSVILTASCTQYWHFMLVQGVVSGASNSLLMFPSMAATPQYFYKKRGAAMGLAIAGSSLGAIVFPIVLSQLLAKIGFAWAVRVCAFIMIPILTFSGVVIRARLPPRKSSFFVLTAFRSARYVTLIGAVFCQFLGMFTGLFFLPTYGISRGMDASQAFYLVAIINAASLPGRIIPGILGDKFGSINSLLGAGLTTSIIILCWPTVFSTAGIYAFSVFFGFTSGAIISAGSVVFTHCAPNPREIGTWMGQGIAVASFAILIGPPINGALLNRFHGFDELSLFSGAMCLMGTGLALMAKWFTEEGVLGKV